MADSADTLNNPRRTVADFITEDNDDSYDTDDDDEGEPEDVEEEAVDVVDEEDTDQSSVQETYPPLSPFNKIAMKCILHECIDQLYILRNINTQDNANFGNTSVEYLSIADRYMGTERHSEFRINWTINNYEKLARDIHAIIHVITECRDEIGTEGRFKDLTWASKVMKKMLEDEKQLIEKKDRNDKYIVELRKKCEEERLKNIRTIEATNADIQRLRFEVEDLQVYTTNEYTYFENWERARREQNAESCRLNEKFYQNIIDTMKKRVERDQRCHMELESYIEESKNDYLDAIQYWMKHYDEEVERRETEMINLKTDMEKLIEDHALLQQKYDAHKAEIEDWLAYKKKKQEKEELEALQQWAAVKIQARGNDTAWWRGVMFRKKLGPYRKKKKGKGKDAKKGKKGKKK
ncbi:hypothetical protein NQ315_004038 [Exocentrus adspersus]|uniref:Dynein regulatory complex protein 9 n=1 Tax=Exocentrus adspersus TaxID=1586481 RepID=A0AAV8W8A3_9CUCU|nr:hypothetical protein NQ315_004038 [Exocentrus adspersus]